MIDVDDYRQLARIASISMAIFYVYNTLLTWVAIRRYKVERGMGHVVMCSLTAVYAIAIFVGTLEIFPGAGEYMIGVYWVLGFCAYYFYLRAIQDVLSVRLKTLKLAGWFSLVLIACHFASLIHYSMTGEHLLMDVGNFDELPVFMKGFYVNSLPNTLGYLVGSIGGVGIVIASISILRSLKNARQSENLIILGVFLTLCASINDTLLGMSLIVSIPLYFVGNMFEAFRFTDHYQNLAHERGLELQEEAFQSKLQLQEARVSEDLLAVLSHDIANGIVLLRSGVENLNKEEALNPKLDKARQRLNRSLSIIEDVTGTTKSYMSFSRGEEPVLSAVDLRETVCQLREDFETRILEKEIKFNTDIAENAQFVASDAAILRNHIFGNLLSNSIKFCEKGGEILFQTRLEESNCVVIEYSDNGLGMSPQVAKGLFADTELSTEVGTYGEKGTGLGMPIVAKFLAKMRGSIEVQSIQSGPRRGTSFTIRLEAAKT